MSRSVDCRRRAALAVALVAVGALGTRRAGAEETFDARVEYHALPPCPSDTALVAKVTERIPRFRRIETAPRRFTVDVTASSSGFQGRLTSTDPAGARTEREVSGSSCDDVVGALGLVLALAIDPGALIAPPAPASEPPLAAPITTAAPVAEDRAAERPIGVAPASRAPSAEWAIGGGAISNVGQVGVAMFGVAFFAERGFTWGAFRPIFRVGGARTWSPTNDVTGSGSASFTWTVGTLDGCPARFVWNRWALTPCLRFDAGALAGSGSNIAHPRDDAKAWLDVGAVARGAWAFASPFFLDLEAGVLVPLIRPGFHFDVPEVTVSTPAPVGAVAAIHLGGRFP